MGLHPTEVGASWRDDVAQALDAVAATDVAIGEVGMDLYWDRTFRDEQMQALEMQALRAVELDLPLVIHCREALAETLEVLSVRGARGVMHSFGGTEADVDAVRRALGDDWYFGINGIVTFKNCKVADALPAITMDGCCLKPMLHTLLRCPTVASGTKAPSSRSRLRGWRRRSAWRSKKWQRRRLPIPGNFCGLNLDLTNFNGGGRCLANYQ